MRGVEFPFTVGRTGRTSIAQGPLYVRGLIEQLLFTVPGERVHRPNFGTGVHHLVFEPGGDEVAAALQLSIQGGLQQWLADEVEVHNVDVQASDTTLLIKVTYSLRADPELRTDTFERTVG